MCPDIIFQTLPSCDLTYDFIVMYLFITLQEKEKAKEKEK